MVLAFLMHSKKYNCNVSITHTMDSWNSNCVQSSRNNAVKKRKDEFRNLHLLLSFS